MKKTGIYLKGGLMVAAFSVMGFTASAQSSERTVSGQVSETAVSGQTNETTVVPGASQRGGSMAKEHNSTSAMRKARANSQNAADVSRKCTPNANHKPYSIRKADFDKLPESRKAFVMENLHQYSIVE